MPAHKLGRRLRHLAILFNGPPKVEASWSWDKCEKLMLTAWARHGLDSRGRNLSSSMTELSHY